jgi:hypothetical protein
MPELELTRAAGDRRLYALDGVGTLRLGGLCSRSAFAEGDRRRWRIGPVGFWRRRLEVVDETGAVVGAFDPHSFRRGGRVQWQARELALRPASSWRERYALADGDRELAAFDGRGWGRRPVKVTVVEPGDLDPGMLLFVAFVVRRLAESQASAATTASAT